MPSRPRITPANDLREVAARHRLALDLTEGLVTACPADIWQHLLTAFADIPALTAEITRLRSDLSGARLDRANLAAAALATITAHHEGEPDPLCYLRDELRAQGHDTADRRGSR